MNRLSNFAEWFVAGAEDLRRICSWPDMMNCGHRPWHSGEPPFSLYRKAVDSMRNEMHLREDDDDDGRAVAAATQAMATNDAATSVVDGVYGQSSSVREHSYNKKT